MAFHVGVPLEVNVADAWRPPYLAKVNAVPEAPRRRARPVSPPASPVSRSSDSVYWSQSEGRSSLSSEAPSTASEAPSYSSESSIFTASDHEDALGFVDHPSLKTESLRVSSRSLDELISASGVHGMAAIFSRITSMTSAYVHFPEYHPGEEDPTIRLVGTPENNAAAKRMILENYLDPGCLMKLTMSIPKCDQSDVAGITGNSIARTLHSTAARIYFSDSDHFFPAQSHRVSLCGPLESVEEARDALRSAAPFIITFDMHISQIVVNGHENPYIRKLATRLNVSITFFPTIDESVYQAVVRGVEGQARKVKEAVEKISRSCLGNARRTVYRLVMSVSKEVLDVFAKDDSAILKTAMDNTETEIVVVRPFAFDGSTKLIICGTLHDIHNAKRLLVGYLPIEMVFEVDYREEIFSEILRLGSKYDLKVMLTPRTDLNALRVTMRATERYVDNVYDAYREALEFQSKAADAERGVHGMEPFMSLPTAEEQENVMRSFEADGNICFEQLRLSGGGKELPRASNHTVLGSVPMPCVW